MASATHPVDNSQTIFLGSPKVALEPTIDALIEQFQRGNILLEAIQERSEELFQRLQDQTKEKSLFLSETQRISLKLFAISPLNLQIKVLHFLRETFDATLMCAEACEDSILEKMQRVELLCHTMIEKELRASSPQNLLRHQLLCIYIDILERLWLFPVLQSCSRRESYPRIGCIQKQLIEGHFASWKPFIEQASELKRFVPVIQYFVSHLEFCNPDMQNTCWTILSNEHLASYLIGGFLLKENPSRAIYHYLIHLEKLNRLGKNNQFYFFAPQVRLGVQQNKYWALGNLGTCYSLLGEHERALSYYQELLALTAAEDKMGENKVHLAMGKELNSLKRWDEAISHFSKAAESEDESQKIKGYVGLGTAYRLKRDLRQAEHWLLKGLENSRRLRIEHLQYCSELGHVYLDLEDYSQAIAFYTEGLQSSSLASADYFKFLNNLGLAHHGLGNYSQALSYFEQYLAANAVHESPEIAGVYGNCADTYKEFGEEKKAFTYYQKALQYVLPEDHKVRGKIFSGMGQLYLLCRDYRKAKESYDQQLQIARAGNDKEQEGEAFLNFGEFFLELGNYLQAEEHFSNACSLFQEEKNRLSAQAAFGSTLVFLKKYPEAEATLTLSLQKARESSFKRLEESCLGGLGRLFFSQKGYVKAIPYFEQQLAISRDFNDRLSQLRTYTNLGSAYALDGKLEEAKKAFQQCLEITNCYPFDLGEIYNNIGATYLEIKQFERAAFFFSEAVKIFDHLQKQLQDQWDWKITLFENQSQAYMGLEYCLLREGNTEEAFVVSDRRRARVLLSTEESQPSSLEDIKNFAYQLKTTFVLYSLTVWYCGGKSIGVWVVKPDKALVHKTLLLESVQQDLQDLPKLFEGFPFARTPPPPSSALPILQSLYPSERRDTSVVDEARSFNCEVTKDKLSQWYQVFIAPIQDELPKDPEQLVTIIPDGFLSQLPFGAFLDSEETHFIEQHTLSFVPSIHTLQLLKNRSERILSQPLTPLLVGNPSTGIPQDNLPLMEKEVQGTLYALLKAAPDQMLLHENATKANVFSQISQARYVHLACHGEAEIKLDPYSVFEGRFKLAIDTSNPQGYFFAQEIAKLRLQAELVFLCSCYSGTGKLQREGTIGPVWSFLAAGALSTIATYWPLGEHPLVTQIVDDFYKFFLEDKMNKAQALRRAILKAKEQESIRYDLWGALFFSGLAE